MGNKLDVFTNDKYVENEKGKLYFMVGLARSGKTTICRKLSKEFNAIILTQDSFRLAVYDRAYLTESEPIVFSHLDVSARALLINGTNVIIDETNTLLWRRNHWRSLGGVGFYVNTPVEVCISRCNPENVELIGAIKRMDKNLDGFNPNDPTELIMRQYVWDGLDMKVMQ